MRRASRVAAAVPSPRFSGLLLGDTLTQSVRHQFSAGGGTIAFCLILALLYTVQFAWMLAYVRAWPVGGSEDIVGYLEGTRFFTGELDHYRPIAYPPLFSIIVWLSGYMTRGAPALLLIRDIQVVLAVATPAIVLMLLRRVSSQMALFAALAVAVSGVTVWNCTTIGPDWPYGILALFACLLVIRYAFLGSLSDCVGAAAVAITAAFLRTQGEILILLVAAAPFVVERLRRAVIVAVCVVLAFEGLVIVWNRYRLANSEGPQSIAEYTSLTRMTGFALFYDVYHMGWSANLGVAPPIDESMGPRSAELLRQAARSCGANPGLCGSSPATADAFLAAVKSNPGHGTTHAIFNLLSREYGPTTADRMMRDSALEILGKYPGRLAGAVRGFTAIVFLQPQRNIAGWAFSNRSLLDLDTPGEPTLGRDTINVDARYPPVHLQFRSNARHRLELSEQSAATVAFLYMLLAITTLVLFAAFWARMPRIALGSNLIVVAFLVANAAVIAVFAAPLPRYIEGNLPLYGLAAGIQAFWLQSLIGRRVFPRVVTERGPRATRIEQSIAALSLMLAVALMRALPAAEVVPGATSPRLIDTTGNRPPRPPAPNPLEYRR